MDVEWLEKDTEGPMLIPPPDFVINPHALRLTNGHEDGLLTESVSSLDSQNIPSKESSFKYPHRLPLLRPELLATFKTEELKRWIGEKVQFTKTDSMQSEGTTEPKWYAIAREAQATSAAKKVEEQQVKSQVTQDMANGNVEADEKETKEQLAKAERVKAFENMFGTEHAILDVEDCFFALNADAFVDRKNEICRVTDESEPSVALVRAASLFLRETVIPDFVNHLLQASIVPQDGYALTKLMHEKGINMRYLGYVLHHMQSKKIEATSAIQNSTRFYVLQMTVSFTFPSCHSTLLTVRVASQYFTRK